MDSKNPRDGRGEGETMSLPCPCCSHYENGGGDYTCLTCKYNHEDMFEPDGLCATCAYDPRLIGVCRSCIDYDRHQPKQTAKDEGRVEG